MLFRVDRGAEIVAPITKASAVAQLADIEKWVSDSRAGGDKYTGILPHVGWQVATCASVDRIASIFRDSNSMKVVLLESRRLFFVGNFDQSTRYKNPENFNHQFTGLYVKSSAL